MEKEEGTERANAGRAEERGEAVCERDDEEERGGGGVAEEEEEECACKAEEAKC